MENRAAYTLSKRVMHYYWLSASSVCVLGDGIRRIKWFFGLGRQLPSKFRLRHNAREDVKIINSNLGPPWDVIKLIKTYQWRYDEVASQQFFSRLRCCLARTLLQNSWCRGVLCIKWKAPYLFYFFSRLDFFQFDVFSLLLWVDVRERREGHKRLFNTGRIKIFFCFRAK